MPVIAGILRCKKCGDKVRSDWKFFPESTDRITRTGKYEGYAKK